MGTSNKTAGRSGDGIPVGARLLLFGAESFVFQFAIQKFKTQDI